jgi:hypothetical protein
MLVFAGKPRRLWRLRIWYVAVPMILCFALFVSLSIQAKIWEEQLSNEAPFAASRARHEAWQNWLVLTAGVLSTGLLGALLMLGTGQVYRVRVKQEELETVRCARKCLVGPQRTSWENPLLRSSGMKRSRRPHIEQVLEGNRRS